MADIWSHRLNDSFLQKLVDFQDFSSNEDVINEWVWKLFSQTSHAKVRSPVETGTVARICSEPKWNAYMDFFEKDTFSPECSKNVGPLGLGLAAITGKLLFDEDNPIKDKHYRPREYMRNQWESRDNPYCKEDPLITLNRLFSDINAKQSGSCTKVSFQQGGKSSKVDRPNIYGNHGTLWTPQLNGESKNYLFQTRIKSLLEENDRLNEKAFRSCEHQLFIITDEEFLNWTFRSKHDISNTKTDDLLTIANNIMLSLEKAPKDEEEKEESLPSPSKYFKPLDVLLKEDELKERNMDGFPDGTFFNVKSDFEPLNFQRSPSGALYLKSECGKVTKYFEYQYQSPTDEFMRLPRVQQPPGYQDFKVKYTVSMNDKATQTGDDGDIVESTFCPSARNASTPIPDGVTASYLEHEIFNASTSFGSLFSDDYQAVDELKTLFEARHDDDPKEVDAFCKHCDLWSNESWLGLHLNTDDHDQMRNIWQHHEMDQVCSCVTKKSTLLGTANNQLMDAKKKSAAESERYLNLLFESLDERQVETEVKNEEARRHRKVLQPDSVWVLARRMFLRPLPDCVTNSSSKPACSVAF